MRSAAYLQPFQGESPTAGCPKPTRRNAGASSAAGRWISPCQLPQGHRSCGQIWQSDCGTHSENRFAESDGNCIPRHEATFRNAIVSNDRIHLSMHQSFFAVHFPRSQCEEKIDLIFFSPVASSWLSRVATATGNSGRQGGKSRSLL
jgi:hypothetical protein